MTSGSGVDVVVDLTKRAAGGDARAPEPATGSADPPAPDRPKVRPSRPARVVLAVRHSAPATRGKVFVGLVLVAAAVAAPLVTRSSLDDARAEEVAVRAAAAEVSDLRVDVAAAEGRAVEAAARAAERAALAREARNAQRHRLAALGLNEATIDAYLAAQASNTELVEFRRDNTTADVDRQAGEIDTMEPCLETAKQSVNRAFNTQFGNAPPPGPGDECRRILG